MNTNMDYVENKLKKAKTFLDRWQDSNAKVWEFTSSHSHITLRLEKLYSKGNLHIVCIDPISFHGEFKWEHCTFTLIYESNIFKLIDTDNDIVIKCVDISFYENCKPMD